MPYSPRFKRNFDGGMPSLQKLDSVLQNKGFEKLKPLQKLNNNSKKPIKQYHDLGYGVPILGTQNYDEFCLKVT